MKAFKKWRKENTYSEICGHEWHNGAELAWRACTEWFYSKLGHSEEDGELKDLIEQELGDK